MLLYRPKQKISTTESEEVKFPASSIDGLASVATSGSYNDLTDKPTVPGVPDVVQTTGTSTTSVMSQKATTDAVNSRLSKTDNTDIEVLGTKKATTTLGGNQLYSPNGMIFGGTAAAAGLVTRGICGVSTPSAGGACSKDNVYVNYDGNNDFNANRQIVLNAGTPGSHLGSNMYQYAVPRGDVVKNWVEAKDYVTSVKVNGNTVASSGGVVDIGTVVTDVSGKQDKITSSNKLAASLVSGLSTVATSGSYNDLSNKPTDYVTTADKAQTVNGVKTFVQDIVRKSSNIDISKDPTKAQYAYIDFWDKNDKRIAVIGSHHAEGKYSGAYLQAKNVSSMGIMADDKDNVKTFAPTPPDTDSSTQLATTEWVRTNYQEKGYAGINGAVLNDDGNVTDKDGNVVDALYFKVASLSTAKTYVRTYLLAEVAMTNIINEQATVLIRCTTESSTSAPIVTITFDNYSYARLLLPKNIFVTADYKSGTAGATFTVWVKQTANFMQQVWNVLAQNTRNYTTTSKREWDIFYSNITKATAVTDIDTAPTGYTRIVANNNNRYSNLEENTHLWQQAENAGITWKRYSDNAARAVFRHYDDGTTENFVVQSGGFLFRPLNNSNTKSIKVDPANGVLYPEQSLGADLGSSSRRWNNAYIKNIIADSVTADNLPFTSDGLSTGTLGSTGLSVGRDYYIEKTVGECLISCVIRTYMEAGAKPTLNLPRIYTTVVPIQYGGTIYFLVVNGLGDVGGNTVPVTFSLKNTSGGTVTNTTVTSGTFKYKRI